MLAYLKKKSLKEAPFKMNDEKLTNKNLEMNFGFIRKRMPLDQLPKRELITICFP